MNTPLDIFNLYISVNEFYLYPLLYLIQNVL